MNSDAVGQLLRYSIVGGLTNLFGYVAYLFITYLGGTPKITMTLLYAFVVLIGFFANRNITFCHKGRLGLAGLRYALVQLLGYLLNFLLLALFVDRMGFAHQLIQAIAIIVVAAVLFVLSRIFVFRTQPTEIGEIQS